MSRNRTMMTVPTQDLDRRRKAGSMSGQISCFEKFGGRFRGGSPRDGKRAEGGKMSMATAQAGGGQLEDARACRPTWPRSRAISIAAETAGADVALCVPATLIERAVRAAPGFAIGGQDVHQADKGAHTGCISAAMLLDAGARLTIVGHSERREAQGESDADVKAKAEAALAAGLDVILCVGESDRGARGGQAVATVSGPARRLACPAAIADPGAFCRSPMSRSGRSEPARSRRSPTSPKCTPRCAGGWSRPMARPGDEVRILYGGSVKASNAAEIFAVADVDGALVGGASLKAADFLPIVEAASAYADRTTVHLPIRRLTLSKRPSIIKGKGSTCVSLLLLLPLRWLCAALRPCPGGVGFAVGTQVLDANGGPVGTVTAVNGDVVTVKTDKLEANLSKASFAQQEGKLLIGMTQAELNAAIEKDKAAAEASLAVGAPVKDSAGAAARHDRGDRRRIRHDQAGLGQVGPPSAHRHRRQRRTAP